ncbi:hypothetical protein STUTZSP0542_05840 [Stutzerimonas marianensis]
MQNHATRALDRGACVILMQRVPIITAIKTRGPSTSAPDNNKAAIMFKHKKIRQATLILIATAVVLILPNLSRLIS